MNTLTSALEGYLERRNFKFKSKKDRGDGGLGEKEEA